MKKIFTLIVLVAVAAITAQAQISLFEKKILAVQTDTLRYRELTPQNVKDGQKYPLVVFLHGAGERGIDNEKQLTWGGQMFLNPVNRDKYPAYVVFPQCAESGYWAYPGRPASFQPNEMPKQPDATKEIKLIRTLVRDYISRGLVDADRVYVIGLSMGGMATYDFACRYPDMVTAAVAICGTVNPSRLEAAKNVHWRIFHGDADNVVPVEASRAAYMELKKLKADVEYYEFPSCTHGSWNPAFNMPDFMKWIFSKTKTTR